MSDEIPILPFEQARDFWGAKIPITREDYDTLASAYRQRAFVVSALARADQTAAVHRSIDRALRDGVSMGDWRGDAGEIFERAGVTGDRHLLNTIFRTNVQAAVSAGRYQQARENIDDQPLGMYDATLDGRTRPTHAAQHGKIYPLDHPYWRTWWPLNGINCRCRVITITYTQARDMGLRVRDQMPRNALSDTEKRRLGVDVEKRIDQAPDPGFDAPPGQIPFQVGVDRLPDVVRIQFLRALSALPDDAAQEYLTEQEFAEMRALERV